MTPAPWHVCRAPADWSRLTRALDECYRTGAEVYCPMLWVRVKGRRLGRNRVILERQVAAYPGWAFAPEPPHVPGIRALTYADGSPVTIIAAAIDRVRAAELRWDSEHRERMAATDVVLPAGSWVRITDGLFAHHVGMVTARTRDGYAVQLDVGVLGTNTITIRPAWVQQADMQAAA